MLLSACSSERQADKEWPHSELSSYAAAFLPKDKAVYAESGNGIGQKWKLKK